MRGKDWILVERGRPLNTVTFESPSHNATILSGLNVLRSKGHLLDITLIAQGQTFHVSVSLNILSVLYLKKFSFFMTSSS